MNLKTFSEIERRRLKRERLENLEFINEEEYMVHEFMKYKMERRAERAKIFGNILTVIPKLIIYITVRIFENTKPYIMITTIKGITNMNKKQGINSILLTDEEYEDLKDRYSRNNIFIPDEIYNKYAERSTHFEDKTIKDLILEKLQDKDSFPIIYDGQDINQIQYNLEKELARIDRETNSIDVDDIDELENDMVVNQNFKF